MGRTTTLATLFFIASALTPIDAATQAPPGGPLVVTIPPPPPSAPVQSQRAAAVVAVADLIGSAGPAFNEALTQSMFQKQLAEEMQKGINAAELTGQRGALVYAGLKTQTAEAGEFQSIDAVSLQGVGPSADETCLMTNCSLKLTGLKPGESWIPMTGYVWLEKKNGEYIASTYDRQSLHARAIQVKGNALLNEELFRTVESKVLAGYVDAVARKAQGTLDANKVQTLLKTQEDASKKLSETEATLARELDRAAKADSVARSIDAWVTVFGLASAANNVYQAFNVPTPAAINVATKADLQALVQQFKTDAANKAAQMTALKKQLEQARQTNLKLIQAIGLKYGQQGVPVTRP
jgi:hypothetical protein